MSRSYCNVVNLKAITANCRLVADMVRGKCNKVKVTEWVNQSKPMPLSGITAKGRLVAAGSKIYVIRSRSRRSRSW